jgi:hypothetical protein
LGSNDLAILSWLFLYRYLAWAIRIYSPTALSIVQARIIGLAYFLIGFILTYAAFIIASTS